EHHERDDDILASGDTIAFADDSSGKLVYNPRGISVRDISDQAGIDRALSGKVDVRTINVEEVGSIRVASVPITRDDRVIGAVQVLQDIRAHGSDVAHA